MVAKSVDKQSVKKTAVTLVLLGVAMAAVAFGVKTVKEPEGEAGAPILCGTTEEREHYLASIGIQVGSKSTVAEVLVPEEFDERFSEYNLMQNAMGFDLVPLKGQCVKKCVYTVTNREDLGGKVSAVLLVKDGTLAGGHLLLDDTGEVLPLFDVELPDAEPPAADTEQETILPAPAPIEDTPERVEDDAETFSTESAESYETGAYPTD